MSNKIDISDLDKFNIPASRNKIIKVVGVGGGGSNAVSHMYKQGIHDVSFVLCNTDNQALEESDIPVKIQLGKTVTNGLGAGNRPEKAKAAAEESAEEIRNLFNDGTKMVFVTAGMGGGTGTGAAPIIAGIAKEMGILTVGIVTIPFLFEGTVKILQALNGVDQLAKNVDALLVINNERLREIHGDLPVKEAFAKADDTLTVAAKSIAEIITLKGAINLDFADVETTLKNGGVAIMSTGIGEGKDRIKDAISNALKSPLLNNNDIYNAKKIMLNFYCNEKNIMMDEFANIDSFMLQFKEHDMEVIWGLNYMNDFDQQVKVTILATGFGLNDIPVYKANKDETEQQKAKLAIKEKNQQIETERIITAYGDQAKEFMYHKLSKKIQYYIFTKESLCNDAVINLVENTPTIERTNSFLSSIEATADSLKHTNSEEMSNVQHNVVDSHSEQEDTKDGTKIIF